MAVVLFDIDGTLLVCRGAGKRAMTRAGQALFGPRFSLDGIDLSGRLDPHILAEAAARHDLTLDAADVERFFVRYLPLLEEELRDVSALPGVKELIAALDETEALLGLLTGNHHAAAPLKLEKAGLPVAPFVVGAFGNEADSRPALAALAHRRSEARRSRPIPREDVLVVGDTPHDVDCAHENGFTVVAVATGRFSTTELGAAGADVVVEDLRDPGPVLDFVARRRARRPGPPEGAEP